MGVQVPTIYLQTFTSGALDVADFHFTNLQPFCPWAKQIVTQMWMHFFDIESFI